MRTSKIGKIVFILPEYDLGLNVGREISSQQE